MASGYEAATEDIRSLVASTLDVATQWDCTFITGASQALADWTAKYQHVMSQGENQLMHDHLARWDRVGEAGIALSCHITTLTTEHEQSTVSGEIFQCRFIALDQAGQIMASIFTCLCNYNTEICRMAMAQTVVPVYTIPNTYRVQQSLWESLKKQKKDAKLEKFRLEQREAKAKEMSKIKHRKLQHEQDFRAVQNYRKSIPGALLESINGADHKGYLVERFQKENNYMSKKCGQKWNLMTVERLLTHIAKYANEPTKRLKEAQQIIKSNFPMVQGMPSGDKCTPEFAVRVLMDCEGNLIDCDHQVYGKEQNIGLHDVISPVAMARVTARETYIVDGIPTSIKADNAFCPFCAYTASNHRAINNHVRMHF